ncbi:GNAT family N-acetyltransferase [Mangrovactinospora gilvigrisea]|uniref:GNAT family N-acetyltransferase n=1 Tax=Mangrovactinospora gilvigrisea TaxID=1428644 RepID=A0A1J7BJ63_9ACTN|nr:GNAT family N-acetyltransferase [Mangrovactinospora gilvigrisea]OIV38719.1 GNAT family N-acetyltransferase [Mangrovactinospora gilvigrisea]
MNTSSLTAPLIDGDGLRLRPFRVGDEADAEAVLRGYADPEFRRWNTPLQPIETLEDAHDLLRRRRASAESGEAASFCVTDAGSGAVLGQVGFFGIDAVRRRAAVGYWVLPEARGAGIARRALTLAGAWAFAHLGLYRIELDHALGNTASCRVAERCGYPLEGTLRGAMFEEGRQDAFRDCHLHARLATDPGAGLESGEASAAPG